MKKRKEEAVRALFDCYKKIEALKEKPSYSPEFLLWRQETEAMIERLFGKESNEAQNFKAIHYNPFFLSCRTSETDIEDAYQEGMEEARKMIVSWMESLGRKPGE